jgi:hypothetical protein
MVGRVQECGCIALPEDLQRKTGLYPGATFQIESAPDDAGLLLLPLETRPPSDPKPGTQCG